MANLGPLNHVYSYNTKAAPYCLLQSTDVPFSTICYCAMIVVQTDANFTLFVGCSQT